MKRLTRLNLFILPWVSGWISGLAVAEAIGGRGGFLLVSAACFLAIAIVYHATTVRA